jgi:uncharacterized protein involved in response to NO
LRPANVEHEARLQRAVVTYIVTGLFFMLLPGTFLGVWNLISISSRHALESLSASWLQAHGHAQVFGWIGTFVLGIGFYSLCKSGKLAATAVRRAWICYALWTSGITLRWLANVTGWEWRFALPVSALLELAGFLIFFATVTHHEPAPAPAKPKEPWMVLVASSAFAFLVALLFNAAVTIAAAAQGVGPAIGHVLDQRLLVIPAWGVLVVAVWGFNARWLPIFLGLRAPDGPRLFAAVAITWTGVVCTLLSHPLLSAVFLLAGSGVAITGLHIMERSEREPKTAGVHPSFPFFIRIAYIWLSIAGCLTVWAAAGDRSGGIWGASRHALTVGFLAAMVFGIGQKVLPAFCGARVLFSKRLMLASLMLLNIGCALRVCAEIPAYEGFAQWAWQVLPLSAVTELVAVTLFAANLLITFVRPPAHVLAQQAAMRSPDPVARRYSNCSG